MVESHLSSRIVPGRSNFLTQPPLNLESAGRLGELGQHRKRNFLKKSETHCFKKILGDRDNHKKIGFERQKLMDGVSQFILKTETEFTPCSEINLSRTKIQVGDTQMTNFAREIQNIDISSLSQQKIDGPEENDEKNLDLEKGNPEKAIQSLQVLTQIMDEVGFSKEKSQDGFELLENFTDFIEMTESELFNRSITDSMVQKLKNN